MNLEDINKSRPAHKLRKRIGRGNASGQGKTSGRGEKGQKARSGYSRRAGFEGGQMPLARRLPRRGFKNFCRVEYAVVNVEDLNRFADGTEVGVAQLREVGLVKGTLDKIKILGNGELTKKIDVKAHRFSRTAEEKIRAAGGSVELA